MTVRSVSSSSVTSPSTPTKHDRSDSPTERRTSNKLPSPSSSFYMYAHHVPCVVGVTISLSPVYTGDVRGRARKKTTAPQEQATASNIGQRAKLYYLRPQPILLLSQTYIAHAVDLYRSELSIPLIDFPNSRETLHHSIRIAQRKADE